MPIFLYKLGSLVKEYWYVPVFLLLFVFAKGWLEKHDGDVAKTLDNIQKNHQEEIKAVKDAAEVREKANAENLKKMEERIALIESQYAEAQRVLNEKKKTEVKQIVKETKDNPEELAKRFSEITGFKVVVPEKP